MLVGKRRHGALWILLDEGFVEEDKVGKAATGGRVGGLKGFEVGLYMSVSMGVDSLTGLYIRLW